MDWLGILIFDGAMCSLVMAINFGGTLYDWGDGREIALWVVAGVLFVTFWLTQTYTPFVAVEDKLYPTHFFRKPIMLNLQFQLFLASGILFVSKQFNVLSQMRNMLILVFRVLPITFRSTFSSPEFVAPTLE